jgi:hypothetical protein
MGPSLGGIGCGLLACSEAELDEVQEESAGTQNCQVALRSAVTFCWNSIRPNSQALTVQKCYIYVKEIYLAVASCPFSLQLPENCICWF